MGDRIKGSAGIFYRRQDLEQAVLTGAGMEAYFGGGGDRGGLRGGDARETVARCGGSSGLGEAGAQGGICRGGPEYNSACR